MAKNTRKGKSSGKENGKFVKAPHPSKVKVKSELQLRKELHRREEKQKRTRFGPRGKILRKGVVPDEPRLKIPRHSKSKKRNIYGLRATIEGRGITSEPKRQLFVSKTRFFESRNRPLPISSKIAHKRISDFVKLLRRRYQGRLAPIEIQIEFIKKTRQKDKEEYWRKQRKKRGKG